MQGTVIEITVAGALIMKPNCCNADCYLLPKDTVLLVDTYRCCRGTGLTDLQVTTVRFVLLPDHLRSKLILTICNQFIAISFSHNTTVCCKISVQCDRYVNRRSVIPSVCSAATFMNRPEVQSCSHPHDISNKWKMYSP